MDFTALNAIQTSVAQRQAGRSDKSQDCYSQALAALEQYTRAPSRDLIKAVIQKLLEAIKLSRSNLSPYIVLGHVYHGLQLPQIALKYLKAAQELAPDSAYVLQLQATLTSTQAVPTLAAAAKAPQEPGEIDYDKLYDEVESLILTEVHQAMAMRVALQPGPDPALIAELQTQQTQLEDSHRFISDQLEIVDQEIDIATLQLKLQPLQQRLRQISRLLAQCQSFVDIHAQILQARTALAALSRQDGLDESHLEPILDHCDRIADQLDQLDAQKLDFRELESEYKILIAAVTKLQDELDEA